MFELVDAETGTTLLAQVELAEPFSARGARGLLGRNAIAADEGLLLSDPLRCIHTIGMRFAIDIVFLDRSLRVVHVARHVRPWRLCVHVRGRHQLEVADGAAARLGLAVGRRVALQARSDERRGQESADSPQSAGGSGDAPHVAGSARCAAAAELPSVAPPAGPAGRTTHHSGRRSPCARTC